MVYDLVFALEKACVQLERFVDNKFTGRKTPSSAQLLLWICSGFSTDASVSVLLDVSVGAEVSGCLVAAQSQHRASFDVTARVFHIVLAKSLYTK